MRYESIGLDENDVPRFELVSKKFEDIEIVNQFGTLHGANTMAFSDIDDDGDIDMFWGDFFESSLLLLENRGSCRNPSFQGEPQPFPTSNPVKTSGYNAATLTDWGIDSEYGLLRDVLLGPVETFGHMDNTAFSSIYRETAALDRAWDQQAAMRQYREMCDAYQVTPRTLRFYESKELLAPIRKGTRRLFTRRDRARLTLILRGKRFGFSLEEIRQLLDLYHEGDQQRTQLTRTHDLATEHLARMEQQRIDLDAAIAELRDQLGWVERRLDELSKARAAA